MTAAASVPARLTAKVPIVSDGFSVTTTCLPWGLMAMSSDPLAVALSGRLPPAMAVRPLPVAQNPVTLGVPSAFITSTSPPLVATLVGSVPPQATTYRSRRSAGQDGEV